MVTSNYKGHLIECSVLFQFSILGYLTLPPVFEAYSPKTYSSLEPPTLDLTSIHLIPAQKR